MAHAGANNNNNNSAGQRQIPIVCPGHTRPLAELQFCHVAEEDRMLLVSACHDKMPMLRDGQTGDWLGTWVGHKGAVWSCRLNATAALAATASGDFTVRLWDAVTGQALRTLPHQHIVKTVAFSPDSTRLATGGHEGLLRIFYLPTILLSNDDDNNNNNNNNNNSSEGDAALGSPVMAPYRQIAQEPERKVLITTCAWWTDSIVLAGGSDGVIRFWTVPPVPSSSPPPATDNIENIHPTHVFDTQTGAEIRDLEIRHVAATGQDVLTVAAGDKVFLYDLRAQAIMAPSPFTLPIHFRAEGGASLHPNGTTLAAGGSDLWVRILQVQTGREVDCLKGHHGPIRCLRYSPLGDLLASGSEDGTIRLWKTSASSVSMT